MFKYILIFLTAISLFSYTSFAAKKAKVLEEHHIIAKQDTETKKAKKDEKLPETPKVVKKLLNGKRPIARCKDGTYYYASHHRGACSHHHGVANWL